MATKQDTAKKDPSEKAQGSKGRVQLNFRIEPDFLARVDAVAEQYGISRTEVFLRSASLVCDRPELLLGESSNPSSNVLDNNSIADRVTALEEVIPLGLPRDCNLEEVINRLIDERLKASSNPSSNGKSESSSQLDVMLDKAEDPTVLEDTMSSSPSSNVLDNSHIETVSSSTVTPTNRTEPNESTPSPETEATEAIGNGSEGKIAAVPATATAVEEVVEGEEAIGNSLELPYGPEGFTQQELTGYLEGIGKNDVSRYQKDAEKFAAWSASKGPLYRPWEWNKLSQRKARYFLKNN